MDTAKVDVRKLQLLNDRINQTLEALNQVRLSVHGLQPGIQAGIPGLPVGLQHTVPGAQIGVPLPFWGSALSYGQLPYAQVPALPFQGAALGAQPLAQIPIGGLAHTTPEMMYTLGNVSTDPILASRIAQTFPFCFSPVSPVI